ncbi:MAG: hypothetical protein AAFP82_19840 [Bacteroidota bacterium]
MRLSLLIFLSFFFILACESSPQENLAQNNTPISASTTHSSRGALLATNFSSLEELKQHISIDYKKSDGKWSLFNSKVSAKLNHESYGSQVSSLLKSGISENDITAARDGGVLKKIQLLFSSPYFVRNREDMLRVYTLARRDFKNFGEGDAAFYDLAEQILYNIDDDDLALTNSNDLSEKGYLNTFNHITAQVFMTTLFSEQLADFIADVHERANMSELITGTFTLAQLNDLEKGPIDNYVDMINNEWGQELGKELKAKYKITRSTIWTSDLLANFLNDVQTYYGWAFGIGFEPFYANNEKIRRFTTKLNIVMGNTPKR